MTCSKRDIEDANKMRDLFLILSEQDKAMVNGYLSALVDKTVADDNREQQDELLAVATWETAPLPFNRTAHIAAICWKAAKEDPFRRHAADPDSGHF